jgi:hypothetical protein
MSAGIPQYTIKNAATGMPTTPANRWRRRGWMRTRKGAVKRGGPALRGLPATNQIKSTARDGTVPNAKYAVENGYARYMLHANTTSKDVAKMLSTLKYLATPSSRGQIGA